MSNSGVMTPRGLRGFTAIIGTEREMNHWIMPLNACSFRFA